MTNLLRNLFLLLGLCIAPFCAAKDACRLTQDAVVAPEVSIIALLADPDRFAGCELSVVGVYGGGVTWSKLYANSEYLEKGVEAGAVNIHFPLNAEQSKVADALEGQFVLVTGIFTVETNPLDGSKKGVLDPVSRFETLGN